MKKVIFVFLSLTMIFSLVACGNNKNNDTGNTENTDYQFEYVGEWKASTLKEVIDGERNYTVSIIELNKDGSGTYKGRELSWSYSAEYNTINITLLKENQTAAFEIKENDGITTLNYYNDVYYRAEDFVPND